MIQIINLKLPTEWIQLFRIILSIYLLWLILLTPRKPVLNDDMVSRFVFGILLLLLVQSDILSGLLLIMIYFLSFQSVLPFIWEGFENEINTPQPTVDKEFIDRIDKNLKRESNLFPNETPEPTMKLSFSFGADEALNLK